MIQYIFGGGGVVPKTLFLFNPIQFHVYIPVAIIVVVVVVQQMLSCSRQMRMKVVCCECSSVHLL